MFASLTLFLEGLAVKRKGNGDMAFQRDQIACRHGNMGTNNGSETLLLVRAVDTQTRKCFLTFLGSKSGSCLFNFISR